MKHVIASAVALFLATSAMAQGVKMPAPSPAQTIKQDFALSSVEVTYSRPAKKDRVIMGDLVPYGKVWRTGANNPTKVKFGEDVKVNGQPVPAGEYALYTIPGKDKWTVILNKGLKNWGSDGYKTEDDVARFDTKPVKLGEKVESFMILFDEVKAQSMLMMLAWDNTGVPIEITADIDGKVIASIDEAMKGDKKPYFQSAAYYFETGRDLKTALDWVNKAIEENPKAFYMVHLKAKIQAKSGDKTGAKATALQSIELSKAANNADYVALNEKLIKSL